MSLCYLMTPVRDALAWKCEELPDGRTLLIGTDRTFGDGDVLSLLVRTAIDNQVTVSDGGQITHRLELHGVNWASGRHHRIWDEICHAYGITETRGRIYARDKLRNMVPTLVRVADAAIALDALLYVESAQEERSDFAQRIISWLHDEVEPTSVEERVEASDRDTGDPHRFTAKVTKGERSVLVRAVGGRSRTTAHDAALKAMFNFSRLNPQEWPVEQRLAIVQDVEQLRRGGYASALAEQAYIGDWDRQVMMRQFIVGSRIPEQRDLSAQAHLF